MGEIRDWMSCPWLPLVFDKFDALSSSVDAREISPLHNTSHLQLFRCMGEHWIAVSKDCMVRYWQKFDADNTYSYTDGCTARSAVKSALFE